MSKVFNYLIYGIFLLLFAGLASVVMPELMQPTQSGKSFVFIYGLSAIVALLFFQILFKKNVLPSIRLTTIDILLGALFVYITINRYLLQEVWGFSLRYYEMIGLEVLYLLFRRLDKRIYSWLLIAIVLSGIVQAVYGSLQLYGFYPSYHSGFRMTGSFFNPGPYAGFLACVLPVALGMYLFKGKIGVSKLWVPGSRFKVLRLKIRNFLLEYLPLAGTIAILLVIPASRSRAAWLSVLVSSLYLIIIKYDIKNWVSQAVNTPFKRISTILILAITIGSTLTGLYFFKQGSADGRLLVWKVAATIIKGHPVFGVGFDRFKAHYMNAQASYFELNPDSPEQMVADNTYYAFNYPLQFAVENGGIGFLILGITGILCSRMKVSPNNRLIKHIALSTILSFFIFGLFSYPSQILPVKMIVVLMLALLANIDAKKPWVRFPETSLLHHKNTVFVKSLMTCACVLVLWSMMYKVISYQNSFKVWQQALATYNYGLYKDSLTEFEKVYPVLNKEGDFLMNYGKALTMAGESKRAVEILERAKRRLNTTIIETTLGDAHKKLGNYQAAESAYIKAANMIPSRFYSEYLLAKLYDETGRKEKARKMALGIMKKEVKVKSMAIEEIRDEMRTIINK